jgi:hypothetical protein
MPTTNVEKSMGAMIVFTILRKILLSTFKLVAKSGKSSPISTPIIILDNIHVVSDFLYMANNMSDAIKIHLKTLRKFGDRLLKLYMSTR